MADRQQITKRPTGGDEPRAIRAQVAATATDALPAYLPNMADPSLEGLVRGLSTFNPMLQKMADEEKDKANQQGAMDRLGSQDKQGSTVAYEHGFYHMDGLIKGQQDATGLRQSYDTEFDKDGGDLEGFIRDKYGNLTKGFGEDDSFIQGYNKSLGPILADIRKDHGEYRKKAVETRIESNAMQLLDNGLRAYPNMGQEVPVEYVEEIRGYLGKTFGVTSARFDQLLFESVKRLGDEGNFAVYDMLKKEKPDGSPGMYYDPAWKTKIDSAQVHAQNAFLEKQNKAEAALRKQREEKQETALYDVFLESDPKVATSRFDDLVKTGLFTRAGDLIKWRKLLEEHVDGKPNISQMEVETSLLTSIYRGGASQRDILSAHLTRSQRQYLLSEHRRVAHENRTLSAQQQQAERAIFKSPEYKSGVDYIKGSLVATASSLDPMGVGTSFDRQQRAAAELEFTRRASITENPADLHAVRDDIVGRYLKRRKEMADVQKELPGAGQLRYSTPAEAAKAAKGGLMTVEELATHLNFFKAQRAPKPANAR